MKVQLYKPTKKNTSTSELDRIFWASDHYVWILKYPGRYAYGPGDCLEWRPKQKKPDSGWTKDVVIDTSEIQDIENVSGENRPDLDKILKGEEI